jgi:hypothetical protein
VEDGESVQSIRFMHGADLLAIALKLCIAAYYTSFSTEIVDDEGIEPTDCFIAGPKGEKLVLSVKAVA